MKVVHASAPKEAKFNDTQTALTRALMRPSVKATAEKWIAKPVADAVRAQEHQKDTTKDCTELTTVVAVGLSLLFDSLCLVREFYYNAGGRRQSDPMMKVLFTIGLAELRKLPPGEILLKVDQLARRIELTAHPNVTPARAKEKADEIRAYCAALAPDVRALTAATEAKEAAEAQFASAADVCRLELASFKRDLRAQKMSEAAIHEIIPAYVPTKRATRKVVPQANTGGPVVAEASVPVVVTPASGSTPTAPTA